MPERLNVYANDRTAVPAKYLEINGKVIYDPSGKPYIVPFDFDWNIYLRDFKSFGDSMADEKTADWSLGNEGVSLVFDTKKAYRFLYDQFHADWPDSPHDVQRTYNGQRHTNGGDFVEAFRPAASFLFGAACAATGLSDLDALVGGGAQNLKSWYNAGGFSGNVKVSPFEYFNNPENVPHIKNGWNFYRNSVSPSDGTSSKAKGQANKVVHPTSLPVNKAPAPTVPTRSEQYGVPDPPGPVGSWSPDLPQPPPAYNLLTGKPLPVSPLSYPGRAPFSPYGNLLTGAPPAQAATADPRPAAFFSGALSPGNYAASSASSTNLLTSPPIIFQEPYETGYTLVRQAQESAAPSQPGSGKPFYSLKDRLDFLGHVYRVAKPVSDETGISLPFILAHAAHEVDFGKKIEGKNLFNIKADETWRGPTYTKGDKAYRAYPSYEESMKDYLEYLESNPRYGKMFEPVTRQSLGRLVDAIHYAGYSDDPLYGPRILAAAKDPIMKQALWQFDKWPPKATEEG